MRGMLADSLLPRLAARVTSGTVVRSRTLRTTGISESLLADKIDSMDGGALGVELAYLPSIAGVDLRLTVRDAPERDAVDAIDGAAVRLRERAGAWIYGEDDDDLAAVALQMCRSRGLTIGLAESCTGGLLGARLTAIPGSSDVVLGGVIAYHNVVKRETLGVSDASLAAHGAVSEEVVREMAAGARRVTGARVGLAITGIAGPSGGTPEKPVGTVWLAVDVDGDVSTQRHQLWGDRAEIRERAAQYTLDLLRVQLLANRAAPTASAASAAVAR
jgi:nicotinamide-nucleotide amidase